jgi:putative membrane protein
MPSERRLHPVSILFNIGKQFGAVLVPLLLVTIGRGSDEDRWSTYALIFLVPYAGVAVGRFFSFRYRYDEHDLVIRRGFIFRNQRHVPYDRVQNIDAVQNPVHRLFGVAEVRLQTGGGSEPEAVLSVLSLADLEDMRRRVLDARARSAPAPIDAGAPGDAAPAPGPLPAEPAVELLALPPRELALYGIIENRGLLVIGAAVGLLFEFVNPRVIEGVLGTWSARPMMRLFRAVERDGVTAGLVAAGAGALLVFLLVSRVFSILWAQVKLGGFRVVRTGQDIRIEYGLLTRVTATIPRRRIQTVTIREAWLHRPFRRASVRVSTAGGSVLDGERAAVQREWLAPIIRRERVPALIDELLPGVSLDGLDWQRVHPRAFRRAAVRRLITAAVLSLVAIGFYGRAAWWVAPLLGGFAVLRAWLYVRHLAWALTDEAVLFREGVFVRAVTIAPLGKVQSVSLFESPFDRRHAMARVSVDTAGVGAGGFRVNVPYLPREAALSLYTVVTARVSQLAFRW